eukprot:5072225-Pleurochrysis_carterae.AAC.3
MQHGAAEILFSPHRRRSALGTGVRAVERLARCTKMAPSSGAEFEQSRPDAAAQGRLQYPAAACQFQISLRTFSFKDDCVRAAHQETQAKSPSLILVLNIFNVEYLT